MDDSRLVPVGGLLVDFVPFPACSSAEAIPVKLLLTTPNYVKQDDFDTLHIKYVEVNYEDIILLTSGNLIESSQLEY